MCWTRCCQPGPARPVGSLPPGGALRSGPARAELPRGEGQRERAVPGTRLTRAELCRRAQRARGLRRLRKRRRLGRGPRRSCPTPAQHGAAAGPGPGGGAAVGQSPAPRLPGAGGTPSTPSHQAAPTGAPPAGATRSPSLSAALPSKIHLGKMKAHANARRLPACAFNHGKLAPVPAGPPKGLTAGPGLRGCAAPAAPGAFRLPPAPALGDSPAQTPHR